MFEVLWKTGDKTWLPYSKISNLRQLSDYFETIGVSDITKLENLSDEDSPIEGGISLLTDMVYFLGSINPALDFTDLSSNPIMTPSDIDVDQNPASGAIVNLPAPSGPPANTGMTSVSSAVAPPSGVITVSSAVEPPASGMMSVSTASGLRPSSIVGNTTSGPAFWLRDIQGVAFDSGTWTFINVELGNRTLTDNQMLDILYYSYARGKGWSVPKPTDYDYVSTHVNGHLDTTCRSYWSVVDDNGQVFHSVKPVNYLCIWTKVELNQMNINFFKLRDNVRARFPKPNSLPSVSSHSGSRAPRTAPSRFGGLGSAFRSIQFTERQAETMVSSLLFSAERNNRRGRSTTRGGISNGERRANARRHNRQFTNSVPNVLGSFSRAGNVPSTSNGA
ncbi:hypothetical protein C8R42DRAFT_688826 [Lentinula raphanica]|nr:hypothetical protein C8R42DRAFT_688826 [Lentinula raphanica]